MTFYYLYFVINDDYDANTRRWYVGISISDTLDRWNNRFALWKKTYKNNIYEIPESCVRRVLSNYSFNRLRSQEDTMVPWTGREPQL